MTRDEKILKGKFLFEDFNINVLNTAQTILKELKPDSSLNEEKIINILLEYYNLGGTQTKLLYPCPLCNDSNGNCLACDELMSEIEYYQK